MASPASGCCQRPLPASDPWPASPKTGREDGGDPADLQTLNPNALPSVRHPQLQRHRDASRYHQCYPQWSGNGGGIVGQPALAPGGPDDGLAE